MGEGAEMGPALGHGSARLGTQPLLGLFWAGWHGNGLTRFTKCQFPLLLVAVSSAD